MLFLRHHISATLKARAVVVIPTREATKPGLTLPPAAKEIPMYDQSKQSELIKFARVEAGSTVIDVYPGDGDWTRLFSDIVGPAGRVYSFGAGRKSPDFKNDPGRPHGRTLLRRSRAGRTSKSSRWTSWRCRRPSSQWMSCGCTCSTTTIFHTALMQKKGATAADFFNRAVYERLKPGGFLHHRRPRRCRRSGHERGPVAASDRPCIRPRGGGGGRLRTGRGKHLAREHGR